MFPSRILAAAALLCCADALAQGPILRTETRTVLVEAVVTGKKSEPVRGLTAKDFHIWQDGKEQAITSVSEDPKTAEPRFLVFFVDDTGMAPADKERARQAMARFIDANAAPNRMMAVVSYVDSLRVAQNFTDDAGKLKDALAQVGKQASGTSVTAFASHNMLQAFVDLARSLGVLPGRKSIVFLTGGIPSTSDMKSEVAAAVEASGKSGIAVYPVDVQPIDVNVGSTVTGAPRTADTPFSAGRGGRGGRLQVGDQDSAASTQPWLDALANGTGGFFTRDSSGLLAALQQIGAEQTQYYVLSYTPPPSKDGSKEGACHALRVKVDRGGASVRARSSYCGTPPVDLVGHADAAKDLEDRAASGDAGSLRASVQLPHFYVSAGVARVHLAMDIPVAPDAEMNLLGIATGADGQVGARISDTVRANAAHYEKEFKIAPGHYTFSLVFDAGNGSFGKIESPLEIPAWNGAELAMSSPVLSRQTRPAGDMGSLSSLIGEQNPLVAGGTEYVPTGSARFTRSESGFFYIEIYDPDPRSVRVRVRVVERKSGEAKWDSGETQPPLPADGKAVVQAGTGLRISTLGTGSYRLEITATDAAGKPAESHADFEVD